MTDIEFGEQMKYLDNLDWRVKLSFKSNDRLSQLSMKFNINKQVSFKFLEDELEVSLTFRNHRQYGRDFLIFFSDLNAELIGDVYVIKHRPKINPALLSMLSEIIEVPTTVLLSFRLQNGHYHIDFIFNKIDLQSVSDAILRYKPAIEDLAIRYVGATGGFLNVIREINNGTPLTISETRIIPVDEKIENRGNPFGDKWARIKKVPFSQASSTAVYFTNDPPAVRDDIHEVVRGSIYSGNVYSSISKFLNREIDVFGIPGIFSVQTYFNPYFVIWFAFPSEFRVEQFRLLVKMRQEMPQLNSVLRRIQPFGKWFTEIA